VCVCVCVCVCWGPGGRRYRLISFVCPALSSKPAISVCGGSPAVNPPHATALLYRWDRHTDGWTVARPLHRPCYAYSLIYGRPTMWATSGNRATNQSVFFRIPKLRKNARRINAVSAVAGYCKSIGFITLQACERS